ncbi:MAG: hypothetical protein IPL07_14070 [Acidimicrobiaceae bacterium]|nr:hypothetical protein [Acidimicrobiaceae bacterium]
MLNTPTDTLTLAISVSRPAHPSKSPMSSLIRVAPTMVPGREVGSSLVPTR